MSGSTTVIITPKTIQDRPVVGDPLKVDGGRLLEYAVFRKNTLASPIYLAH
jgi:hypothetical protein